MGSLWRKVLFDKVDSSRLFISSIVYLRAFDYRVGANSDIIRSQPHLKVEVCFPAVDKYSLTES